MTHNYDPEVNLKVGIPKSLDRSIEEFVYKRETTKKAFVEEAVRAYIKILVRAEKGAGA